MPSSPVYLPLNTHNMHTKKQSH